MLHIFYILAFHGLLKVCYGVILYVFIIDVSGIWKCVAKHEQRKNLFGSHYACWMWVHLSWLNQFSLFQRHNYSLYMIIFSINVRFNIWKCFRHHSKTIFGHSPVSRPNESSSGVHSFPPNTKSTSAATWRVFSARMELHKWHRYDNGEVIN